jgi:hypothetical protein
LSQLREFKDERYAKAVWNGLREFYLPLNTDRTDTIKSDIGFNKCTPDMDLDQWLLEMKQSYDTLIATDERLMSKREFTLTILRNMPKTEAWRVIVNGYKAQIADYDKRGVPIKPSEFISKIRDENWLYTKDNPQSSNYVFTARSEANKRTQKRKANESPSSGSAKRARGTNDKGQTCPNCAKEGHSMADCLKPGGGVPATTRGGGKALGIFTSLLRSVLNKTTHCHRHTHLFHHRIHLPSNAPTSPLPKRPSAILILPQTRPLLHIFQMARIAQKTPCRQKHLPNTYAISGLAVEHQLYTY